MDSNKNIASKTSEAAVLIGVQWFKRAESDIYFAPQDISFHFTIINYMQNIVSQSNCLDTVPTHWEPGLCSTHIFWADSTLTHVTIQVTQLRLDSIPNLLTWLNSDSIQIPDLLSWFNADSIHLSQSWVKSDSRLITIWPKVVDRWRSNVAVGCFFPCKSTDKCKILTFSLQKKISDVESLISLNQYPVDSTLTQMTSSVIRLWIDSYPWFSRPTQLSLDSFESESSQIWLTTRMSVSNESSTTLLRAKIAETQCKTGHKQCNKYSRDTKRRPSEV